MENAQAPPKPRGLFGLLWDQAEIAREMNVSWNEAGEILQRRIADEAAEPETNVIQFRPRAYELD